MDRNNLHGSIHQGMAEAIENSYIVLFCMNHQYFNSEFCQKGSVFKSSLLSMYFINNEIYCRSPVYR